MSFTTGPTDKEHIPPHNGEYSERSEQDVAEVKLAPDAPSEFPEGGVRAWTVAVACSAVLFSTFGYVNSFGVLQQYYQSHQLQHKTPSDISWIGSLQLFFLFAASLIGGPMFDRYGGKALWPAALLHIFSIMMTSLCTEYYQFLLAQGVLGGIGIGMSIAPALAATGQYFQRRRAAAMGLTVAGSSLGGVLFPIMLANMLAHPRLGFAWALRICGFVVLAVALPACAAIRARLPPRTKQLLLPRAFREGPFVAVIAASFVLLLGTFIPPFYLPDFAIAHGMSARLAPYLVAIYNAASLLGRVGPGIVADRVGRFNIYFAAALSSGVLGFCWQATTSNAAVIVFAALYGFCSGAIVSMMSVCFTLVPQNPKDIGTYLGMGLGVCSIAPLIGPPISGAILSHSGFGGVADFSGAVSIAGAGLIVVAKYVTGKGVFSKA